MPSPAIRVGKSRTIRLVFYYDSSVQPKDCDVPRILATLKKLEELGVEASIIDTIGFDEHERTRAYLDAIVGAVVQQAAIRQVFGSRRDPGFLFGKVPALLIFDASYKSPICIDVYPQKQSIIDGNRRSIESYLDDAMKTWQPSAWYSRYLDEARRALQGNLSKAAVLYAVLAIDSFIWRVLWGQNDIVWIGVDDGRHKWSSVDFVYQYALKSSRDFPKPEQFEKLKENNKSLFKKLRDTDSFLLGQAVGLGILEESEREMVQAMRTIRNVSAHFSPYEVTLGRYRIALQKLGITTQPSFRDIEQVAEAVIEKAAYLLSLWQSRIHP